MNINDLKARVGSAQADLAAALNRVLHSGWFVLGPEVKAFEAEFAAYLGTQHCLGVANGTDALELGLKALGAGQGSRVATVANAGMYTTGAVLAAGAEPIYMDVHESDGNVALAQVQRAVGAGAQVVVVTHLYGVAAAETAAIADWCAGRGVALLEDCAQAHGARLAGRCVGTFGDAAAFSFYPTKNLGALGDGGAIVTARADIAERVARLRQYGWSRKYAVALDGGRNSRLDELQAAVLRVFLPLLDAHNAQRRAVAGRYAAEIRHPEVQLPSHAEASSVAHLYVVRCPHRESLRAHLPQCGIGSDVHYPIPDHRQPVFGDRFASLRLETTEHLAAQILTLPCYPEMQQDQVDRVIAAVNAWER